ncbi:unnamed protein product, partial [Porites lobata]
KPKKVGAALYESLSQEFSVTSCSSVMKMITIKRPLRSSDIKNRLDRIRILTILVYFLFLFCFFFFSVSCSYDKTLRIWQSFVTDAIVTSSGDDCIRIFQQDPSVGDKNQPTFHQVAVQRKAHSQDVNGVKWHPKESGLLASCSDDEKQANEEGNLRRSR